jgi:hypothetical protein
MDVGLMMIFASYGWNNIGDDQVWDEDLRLARQAPVLGFDALWSAEHHFFDYSFCPDNLQLMTYLAGVCPNIDLGTAAVILPWHDPLRVAEQAAVCPNDDDHRFLPLRAEARRGGDAGAQAHGQIRREQLRSLRVPRRALRHREGL